MTDDQPQARASSQAAWVYLGAFGLTSIAGLLNAVTWLGETHRGVTHVTGTLTDLGTHLGSGDAAPLAFSAAIVACFFAGAVFSGALIGDVSLRLGRRYGVGLVTESALLFAAFGLARSGNGVAAACLIAGASGLQNALATAFSGAVLRTTHMTGVVTDLGIALGQAVRGSPVAWSRVALYVTLLAGFVGGGVAGASARAHVGDALLLAPALALLVGGAGYWRWTSRLARRAGLRPG